MGALVPAEQDRLDLLPAELVGSGGHGQADLGQQGRQRRRVDAQPGRAQEDRFAVETILLAPIALAYLIFCEAHDSGAFGHSGGSVEALLVLSGVVTSVPLFLFAYGARRIPFSTMGVIQFIGPSLQLACGIFVFKESFDSARATGFVLIWIGLLIYAAHGFQQTRRRTH